MKKITKVLFLFFLINSAIAVGGSDPTTTAGMPGTVENTNSAGTASTRSTSPSNGGVGQQHGTMPGEAAHGTPAVNPAQHSQTVNKNLPVQSTSQNLNSQGKPNSQGTPNVNNSGH